jgi:hypothetical protein
MGYGSRMARAVVPCFSISQKFNSRFDGVTESKWYFS